MMQWCLCVSELTSLNTDNVEDDDNEDIAGSSAGLYHVRLLFVSMCGL